ncbi:MAG: sulfate adenylyltransferase subunit CysN [Planctomycetaceae bacterium]|nr:sulfate adenylyltransferase subunit CysN [Planctomycetales bacterium]MCB9872706.1 sulfate adenylyltransferase subunit CysN [Planctomycetaceae bacterium]MCB9926193.1 sulfate adenylyltransferase subunit CysN [Planctomycetaceae bacterium]
MSHQSDLIATDIDAYLAQHEKKELLRFLTCGSVDDGKSTLIGRLFYDAKLIYEDTLKTLEKDSATHGTTGGGFDPALFTDGLKAEREQGITIDVAYRYFSTAKRKFIIADTPGHEQYTRNMATGASTCDLAIILVDARHGVVRQTKRHSFIVSLLGIKHVLVAVNKMDLVDYSEEVYDQIRSDYKDFVARLDIPDLHFLPISALLGDNIVDASKNMPWYQGTTMMSFLDSVYIGSDRNLEDFRFPVQYVNRPHLNFRGFCGTIASGIVRQGDEVMALPSRKKSRVKSIVTFDGDLKEAFTPQSVTLTLEDEIDVSRGDMIVRPGNVPRLEQKFDAMVVWMHDDQMVPGKTYIFKQATKSVTGTISTMRYQIDVNTLHRQDAPTLKLNEIGRCSVSLSEPVCFDGYRRNRTTGAFIIVDRISNATLAAGMILNRSTGEDRHDHWDDAPQSETLSTEISAVSSEERSARFGQTPVTILLTGLTGAGKTTIAYALERRLFDMGRAATVLDGQNMRRGISRDLGFGADDRSENLRRSAEVAKLINDAGLICIGAFVAPNEEVRQKAAEVVGTDRFLVVYLSAPVEVCRQRDTDGHYPLADSGELANFPGVSSPYETPAAPHLVLPTHEMPVNECVDAILQLLEERGMVS